MNTYPGQIVGIGAVLLDHIALLPTFPAEDTKMPALVPGPGGPQLGGPTPVRLLYLAQLGWEAAFCGVVGGDTEGRQIRQQLESAGVDTRGVVVQSTQRSGYAHVWISKETGSRTIAFSPGTTTPMTPDLPLLQRLLTGSKALILDDREPEASLAAVDVAVSQSVPVFLDTENLSTYSIRLIRSADVLQAPLQFTAAMFQTDSLQDGACLLRKSGARIAIVTDGVRGAAVATQDGVWTQPAFAVATVDSLGAGDIFGAALIHGLLTGQTLTDSMSLASAAAALSCTHWGKKHLATESDVSDFLAGFR